MTEESSFVLQGSVSSAAVVFLQEAVLRMVPYFAPSVLLILLDLCYGIRGARARGEKVRLSTAVRRSVTKCATYLCWIILASTLALAFHTDWLEWAVLGLVYVNEFASIVGNYLETKGITFSLVHFYRWLFRLGSEKAGMTMDEAEAAGIIRRPNRDPKTGRYAPKQPKPKR